VTRDRLRERAAGLQARIVEWRRDLHRHPELGFEERRTAAFLAERLTALGLEVRTGVARTGVIGVLRAPGAIEAAVLLRSDMDALPVHEVEGRSYGSTVAGKMHACGHDGHMAMMLGAATLLAESRDELRRNVVFCFQPAEEGLGGARAMLDTGLLAEAGVGSAYGLHLWSLFPSGTLHMRPGPAMAAQDEFSATVIGRSGHAALPHRALDPVVSAAHAIIALQSVVSRSVDPTEAAVVSVGSVHGGSAPNVIPGEVRLEGTLRSFSEEVRETLRRRVAEVLDGAARAHGCTTRFELRPGYPAVVNDPAATLRSREIACEVVGAGNVIEHRPMAASEDFAYFLREVPGTFIFVGAGNEARGITAPHHSADFDIDESVLPTGAELLARLALDGR
jgi:amidohydrolase